MSKKLASLRSVIPTMEILSISTADRTLPEFVRFGCRS